MAGFRPILAMTASSGSQGRSSTACRGATWINLFEKDKCELSKNDK